MIGIAGLMEHEQRLQCAARLLGAAEHVIEASFDAIDYFPVFNADYKRLQVSLEERLGENMFNQPVEEGREMASKDLD